MTTAKYDQHSKDRLPHVILDRDSRVDKARKIAAVIGNDSFQRASRILEIGCGSGVIASSLSRLCEGRVEIHAVDVLDNRTETSGYRFHLVSGPHLPFEAGVFDIVITNHVIEHVGQEEAQLEHLKEIHRVLSDAGTAYLAVPNKWRLVEPHFRLPLLSWLPQTIADRYVKLMRRGDYYDCLPLSHRQALRYFKATSFSASDRTLLALRETLSIEYPESNLAKTFNRIVPDWILRVGMCVMPTYIFLLRRNQA